MRSRIDSVVVGARLSRAEYEQLLAVCRREEEIAGERIHASDVIREALYRRYGIGSLVSPQPTATHMGVLTPR